MTRRREQGRAIFLAAIMVMSVIAIGAAGFAGSAAAANTSTDDITDDEGANQNVTAGSSAQALDRIVLEDTTSLPAFGGGETVYQFPDGITVNEAESDISAFGSGISVTGVEVAEDGSSITVLHDGDSSENDTLTVRDIVVDTGPDVEATKEGADLDITVEHQSADTDVTVFNVYKPEIAGGVSNVALGTSDEALDTDYQIDTKNITDQIANQSTITVFANESNGLTWDTNLDTDNVVEGSSALDIDTDGITVSDNELSIPVEADAGAADDQIEFDGSELKVNTTGDAPVDEQLNLTATVQAVDSTGDVTVVSNAAVVVDSPNTDILAPTDSISVAKSQQEVENIGVKFGADEVGAGTNVTIITNRTDVTFDTTSGSTATIAGNANMEAPLVTDNSVTATFNESDSDMNSTDDEEIEFQNIQLNTTETADLGAVEFSVQFQSSDDSPLLEVANTSDFVTLTEPSADFSGANQELFVDNDGIEGVGIENITVRNNSDTAAIDSSQNATIELPADTGVTFDTASVADANASVDDATVSETLIDVQLNQDGTFNVSDDLRLNVTADADEVVIPDATVYTGDFNYTVALDDQINVSTAAIDNVDASGDGSVEVDEIFESSFSVESSELGDQDGVDNKFGGADVELSIQSQPDEADFMIDDLVTASSLVTDSNGEAEYNFSAGVTGEYVIDHNASEQANATTTYTVTSGDLESVEVDGAENAFRGGASDINDNLQTGVYKVDVRDENGNLATVDDDFEFRVLVGGDTSELLGLSDNLADNGQAGSANASVLTGEDGAPFTGDFSDNNVFQYNPDSDDTDEQGTFYVYVANDLAEDIDVQIVPRGDSSDIDSDTGTATFFSSADSIDLSVDETVTVGEFTDATATVSTSAGDVIEVPRIVEDFESDNTDVLDIEESEWTNTDGEAIANLSAVEAGTANLTAELDELDTSTEITVVEEPDPEPANFQVSNVSPDGANVTFGESIDVTADVENIGDEDGTQTVEFRIDLNLNGTLEEDEEIVNQSVSLNSSESTEVVFEDIDTSVLENETYTHGVFSSNDSATATITVVADEDDDGDAGDGDLVEAPGGVTIPSKYVSDGIVNSGGLGDAAFDFRAGDIDSGTLGDVALAFRES